MNVLHGEKGVLTIVSSQLVLPTVSEIFNMQKESFPSHMLEEMLMNPTTSYYAIMMPISALESKPVVGCLVELTLINLREDHVQLQVAGNSRVALTAVNREGEMLLSEFENINTTPNKPEEAHEIVESILSFLAAQEDPDVVGFGLYLKEFSDPSALADQLFTSLHEEDEDEAFAAFLLETSTLNRLREVHKTMVDMMTGNNETDVADDEIKSNNPEVKKLINLYNVKKEHMSSKAIEEIGTTLRQLSKMSTSVSDYSDFFQYVNFAVNLPFTKETTDKPIAEVEAELEASHYGMKKAKERLLEQMAIRELNPNSKGMIILLDGAPGTGKTTLAIALAKAMGREYERISMGGCADAHFIKGFERSYKGSRHGRIMAAMHHAKVKNPVIILDEVEKVMAGNQGDPDAALLEVLDPEQNDKFTDNYLGFDYDLSKVIFIATSNDKFSISPAVMDRMEVIDCEGYSREEKILIANKYTIPKACKDIGIEHKISKSTLLNLINGYTREAGVRTLEKIVKNLLRKVAVEQVKGKKIKLTKKVVEERLGQPYPEDKPLEHDAPGIVTGMYYSVGGGGCLDIESLITEMDGSGCVNVTGKAGEVMTESISLVHAHMIAKQKEYGLNEITLSEVDIHLHMPDGSTPKDGPSAGAAYSLLFASLAANKPVKKGLAMTGECTLTGRITAIGGVDQKCSGAVRIGMTDIILPEDNRRDYEELPEHVKKGARYHFVKTVEEVINIGLER